MKTFKNMYLFPHLMDIVHDMAMESLKLENDYAWDYKKNTQKYYDEMKKYCDLSNNTFTESLDNVLKNTKTEKMTELTKKWLDAIKSTLRTELYELIGGKEWQVEKVAKDLGITSDEVNAVFDADCNISLTTAAKILSASNYKLEIVKINQPKESKPEPESFKCHCGSGIPCGKICKHDMSGDLNDMDRNELLDIIYDNGWDDEIDTKYATRDELEEFIEEKEAEFAEYVAKYSEDDDQTVFVVDFADEETSTPEEGSTEKFMDHLLNDKLKDNPHLAEKLKNILKN